MTNQTYTWTHKELDTEFNCTYEELKSIATTLKTDGDTLADLLTGYTSDEYADDAEDLAQQSEGDEAAALEYDADTYNRVRTYHLLMNVRSADEASVREFWLSDFKDTAEG
jgi:methyl-accepting chemotaxis protein